MAHLLILVLRREIIEDVRAFAAFVERILSVSVSHVAQMVGLVVGNVGQEGEVDDALEWELEHDVEDDAGGHYADDVAEAKLEYLVELYEKAVCQLTVDQLDHERRDQSRLKRKFAENAEDRSTHEGLTKVEATSEEDKQDHPSAQDVGRPR